MYFLKKARGHLRKIGILDEIQELYDENNETFGMDCWIIQIYVATVKNEYPEIPIDVILRGFPEGLGWLKRKLLLLYSGKKMFDWTRLIQAVKEVSKDPNEDVKTYIQSISPVRRVVM